MTSDEQQPEIFKQLADSLRILTNSAQSVSGTAKQISAAGSISGLENIDGSLLDPAAAAAVAATAVANGAASTPAAPEQKQKRKIEKDPNAPKKPLTVFFAYSAYTRQALREERMAAGLPALSSTELTQEISKKWNELSEAEKEKWKEAYVEELGHYHVKKEHYLEAKKNGEDVTVHGPNPAPIAIPSYLKEKRKAASTDENVESSHSSEKKDKKEKKKEKKKRKLEAAAASNSSFSDTH